MIYMVKQSYNNQKGIPEYTLSSTRGTAQKKVGFSSPRSSINNLTSCSHSENDGQGHIQIQKNSNFWLVGVIKLNLKFNYHYELTTSLLHILTPRQKPIEPPCHINVSSMTLSKVCARGRYDKYTSFSVNCKQRKKRGDFVSQRKDTWAFSILNLKRKRKKKLHPELWN